MTGSDTEPEAVGTIVAAFATRRGTRDFNADSAAVHRLPGLYGAVAAAVVDGIGNSAEIARTAEIAAEIIVRVAARRNPTHGILAAAQALALPPGCDDAPDGVAVVAVAHPDGGTSIAWTGDARAYGWDGYALGQLTTDHTVGAYLRQNGLDHDLTSPWDDWIRTTLGRSTLATVHPGDTDERLVLLVSDGVVDGVGDIRLLELIADFEVSVDRSPQVLADAIVAAARADKDGYRDDATVVVMVRAESA